MKLINYFRLLLLGMWLGAAVFLSAVLAPSAFLVLRGYQSFNASEIAGAIVNRNLIALNLAGFVIGLIVFVTGLFRFRKIPLPAFLIEMICAATLSVATAIGHWVIAAKLRALRLTLTGPIDERHHDLIEIELIEIARELWSARFFESGKEPRRLVLAHITQRLQDLI